MVWLCLWSVIRSEDVWWHDIWCCYELWTWLDVVQTIVALHAFLSHQDIFFFVLYNTMQKQVVTKMNYKPPRLLMCDKKKKADI